MASPEIPCAASTLLSGLLDGSGAELREVARTRVSVHYETGDARVPVLTVCTRQAVRLPNSLVTAVLPATGCGTIGSGALRVAGSVWRVRRWWQPPRPVGLGRPTAVRLAGCARHRPLSGVPLPDPSYDGLRPADLVGSGPGLTPAGDDVLAGALVAAHATGDPRLAPWSRETRRVLTATRTTAVSRAMLHHALSGYATPELADFLTVLCRGGDLDRPAARLLDLGHTSGGALLTGVLHTLGTHHLEGAA